ncbi:MAG: hypothetical protein ACLR17_17760 [Enterobacteriaceae bacterium]
MSISSPAPMLEYYAGLIPALEGSRSAARQFIHHTRREPLVVWRDRRSNYPIQIACGNPPGAGRR